jgi:hypothetical protein
MLLQMRLGWAGRAGGVAGEAEQPWRKESLVYLTNHCWLESYHRDSDQDCVSECFVLRQAWLLDLYEVSLAEVFKCPPSVVLFSIFHRRYGDIYNYYFFYKLDCE